MINVTGQMSRSVAIIPTLLWAMTERTAVLFGPLTAIEQALVQNVFCEEDASF
jgi:hypothetical protein